MNKPQTIRNRADLLAYAQRIIAPHIRPACPDCLAADGGYRDTELCQICYADRYAEDKGERDNSDGAE